MHAQSEMKKRNMTNINEMNYWTIKNQAKINEMLRLLIANVGENIKTNM